MKTHMVFTILLSGNSNEMGFSHFPPFWGKKKVFGYIMHVLFLSIS